MNTIFRTLTRNDEPFLREMLYQAIHIPSGEKPSRDILQNPDVARYVANWMKRSGDFGFKAVKNGVPVGAAWIRCWTADNAGYGFIDEATPELSMSVLRGYRDRGIGTKLLRELLSSVSQRFESVSLSVSVTNPALRLYEREGFTAVGKPDGGSVTMIKRPNHK